MNGGKKNLVAWAWPKSENATVKPDSQKHDDKTQQTTGNSDTQKKNQMHNSKTRNMTAKQKNTTAKNNNKATAKNNKATLKP